MEGGREIDKMIRLEKQDFQPERRANDMSGDQGLRGRRL
jgi:hypothetical protein